MVTGAADKLSLRVNGGTLWLCVTDNRGMPVTVSLGEASRALGELSLSVAKLELSRALCAMPRGH